MATKQEERNNINGPWNKAAIDEPLFIVRAQDESAPYTITAWICSNILTAPADKLREALECAIKCREWPNRKVAD